jgi:hypothetical protein
MNLPFCVACLAKEDLEHHHLVNSIAALARGYEVGVATIWRVLRP